MAIDLFADETLDGVMDMTEGIMSEGYTHQDFADITDEEMEVGYANAFNLFNQNQFAKAETMFRFLCHLNHYESKYWIGLGAAQQQQKKYEEAVKAYGIAGMTEADNPIPSLRAAECFIAMGKLDEAGQALAATKSWCGDQEEFAQISARADLLLESVQKKKGN